MIIFLMFIYAIRLSEKNRERKLVMMYAILFWLYIIFIQFSFSFSFTCCTTFSQTKYEGGLRYDDRIFLMSYLRLFFVNIFACLLDTSFKTHNEPESQQKQCIPIAVDKKRRESSQSVSPLHVWRLSGQLKSSKASRAASRKNGGTAKCYPYCTYFT